jgi:hypothetical protein
MRGFDCGEGTYGEQMVNQTACFMQMPDGFANWSEGFSDIFFFQL